MHPAIRLIALSALAAGCGRATADEHAPPPRPAPTPFAENAGLLAPIQIDSLTLTPIVQTGMALVPKQDVDVLVLDEAFEQKLVTIKETENETVNSLTLTNKATKPLFLLAGEVVLGGKQDRIIGQNTVIASATTQSVPVFCVEHGRWTEGDTGTGFRTAKALAHGRLRGKASFETQQAVWNEVAEKNAARQISSSTGTYRQVANQQANGSMASQEQRVTTALAALTPTERMRMIGYVVALNGKVATVDMFDSPTLFHKLETKLVHSYLTEAVDTVAETNVKPPTAADVTSFMADADKATAETSYETGAASTVRFKGDKAAKAQVEYKMGPHESKMAKPMYKTYQAK